MQIMGNKGSAMHIGLWHIFYERPAHALLTPDYHQTPGTLTEIPRENSL